jgi:hypothetical protein
MSIKNSLAKGVNVGLFVGLMSGSTPALSERQLFKTVYTLTGECDTLSTPSVDFTSLCSGLLFRMVYENGRESFSFPARGQALISFSGFPGLNSPVVSSLKIDHVTIASGPNAATDAQAATGSCELTIPKPETFAIKCNARGKSGAFAASFVSDGKRPERQDF